MTGEWRMFKAVLSDNRTEAELYEKNTLRLHYMSKRNMGESHGYVEQRHSYTTHTPRYFMSCLVGSNDARDVEVSDLETGMNLLQLMVRERTKT
jgi:hypothetical protein